MNGTVRGDTGAFGSVLLERDESLDRLTALASAAFDGRGAMAAVVGGAGDGKTALLEEAGALGSRKGYRVWRAYGSPLERPFAFGVARQLLTPAVAALEPDQRDTALTGAARLAARVLDLDGDGEPLDPFAARHGLYWLLVNLACHGSTMLLVDDAHWADEPSLEWLASLMPRLDNLPILVLVATRPPAFDGVGDALAALLSDPRIPLLRVGPLSPASVGALVERHLGIDTTQSQVEAVHRESPGGGRAVARATAQR